MCIDNTSETEYVVLEMQFARKNVYVETAFKKLLKVNLRPEPNDIQCKKSPFSSHEDTVKVVYSVNKDSTIYKLKREILNSYENQMLPLFDTHRTPEINIISP